MTEKIAATKKKNGTDKYNVEKATRTKIEKYGSLENAGN